MYLLLYLYLHLHIYIYNYIYIFIFIFKFKSIRSTVFEKWLDVMDPHCSREWRSTGTNGANLVTFFIISLK